jgi:hypothetical protein
MLKKKGTIYVLDDKKVYTILEIISFHYERHTIQGDRINNWPNQKKSKEILIE